ncbi:hypothetical protein Bbelb_195400 [Branchiostoma belcheri]|nr:hypothetical protein Bbelb_195400 [Branchiostoma belcheri]
MAADHSDVFEKPRRLLQTPVCVRLPMENRWFLAKSLKLPTRKTQDDGTVTLSVQHLCANQSVAFKGGEQVDSNRSWLVESVAPALPSMTDAVHTERRHRLQNGRLQIEGEFFLSFGRLDFREARR